METDMEPSQGMRVGEGHSPWKGGFFPITTPGEKTSDSAEKNAKGNGRREKICHLPNGKPGPS